MTRTKTTRALTEQDSPLLRTATRMNVNWSGEERFTYRDIDQAPDIRHYYAFRSERGDFGVVAERDGHALGVVWLLFLEGDDPPPSAPPREAQRRGRGPVSAALQDGRLRPRHRCRREDDGRRPPSP